MKQRLSAATQQHLVLTPQLRQAIRLLQLSATELEAEVAEAVANNPLLDWQEAGAEPAPSPQGEADNGTVAEAAPEPEPPWEHDAEPWQESPGAYHGDHGETDHPSAEETLQDHLLWQLHLGHFSPRDTRIGIALIDAIDDDGYLREDLAALAASLRPDLETTPDEMLPVLHRIQQFDPIGVGACDLGECLRLQLRALPEDTPGREAAFAIAAGPLQQLPKIGIGGVCTALGCAAPEAETAVQLLRTLDPRPGAQHGALPAGTYVSPDCVIWRQHGLWRAALAAGALPRVAIQRDYQQMIRHASADDADYLRGHLQEARWLLKGLESRADTLLRVVRCLVREQAAFLEFGPQALRPLTLRSVAAELGLHESTVSRVIARKYVRTPRGTMPLRDFFASGIDTFDGGSASSTAIQDRIRQLVAGENPRKPLSDARLADTLKVEGVPVARRTVAKYREALQIPASHERVRIG
ncbi:RNA polymerase factor sigma-54 [Thermomonas brevis]|uniref:RNA polymerase sigma-54 factor n=1 Tax=Thermomonas brevis TaxID=215691 RepID=A0A7G9QVY3_9GAMM|nr:RNA polymerase factor sigma-54 [Thermomonas brevis]QNN47508.1 RNA polymerase factor sigma-54 [Thermomonas brevis]